MKTTHKIMAAAVVAATTASQALAQGMKFQDETRGKIDAALKGSDATAENAIQVLIGRAMLVLGILAVCYGLYGGFLMLTAGGDEKKVEQGKTILFQVALGLIVIFLANSIVQWVLTKILA